MIAKIGLSAYGRLAALAGIAHFRGDGTQAAAGG